METPRPLWGSPGAELSTWTTFQFCCETAIHGHALRHGPPELYSAIQRYTLYSYTAIQLYSAIHYRLYNLYNTPLLVCPPRATANARGMPAKVAKQGCRHILNMYGEIWSWVSWRVAPEHFGPFWHLSPRGCRVAGALPGRVAGLPGRCRVSAGLPGAAGRGRVLVPGWPE